MLFNQWLSTTQTFFLTFALTATGLFSDAGAAAPSPGVAVVELFTSEGCSSCPMADAALADLIARRGDQHIYALAFHVDYFNDLGWADPFSDAAYTARQQAYGTAMKLDSIYTPQALVNGQTEFVGSNRDKLAGAVAAALATPAIGSIDVMAKTTPAGIEVAAVGKNFPADVTFQVALVERGLSTVVPRGENGGRTLTHENLVRAFQTVAPDNTGRAAATMKRPASLKTEKASIIVFAQQANRRVVAATEVPFP